MKNLSGGAACVVEVQRVSRMTRNGLLADLSGALAREIDLDAWLGSAAVALAQAMDAERASLWLVDAEAGDLVTRVAILPELPTLRQPIDRGIVGSVVRTGEVLRINDASSDPRFDPSADRITGFRTRTIVAAPIREDASSPVRGVVQVLNRKGGVFYAQDAAYLERLGRADLAALLLAEHAALLDDAPPRSLVHLYVAQRALVRAKVRALRAEQGDATAGD